MKLRNIFPSSWFKKPRVPITLTIEKVAKTNLVHGDISIPNVPITSDKTMTKLLIANRPIVYKYMLKRLRPSIEHNTEKTELFRSTIHGGVAVIGKSNYESILNEMLTFFSQSEEYEMAAQIRDLIVAHNINSIT